MKKSYIVKATIIGRTLYVTGQTPGNTDPAVHPELFSENILKAYRFTAKKDARFFVRGPGNRRIVEVANG